MKEVHAKAATEVPTSSVGQCKVVYDDVPINNASSNKTNEIHGVSFIDEQEDVDLLSKGLPCQLPPKDINPRSFTIPCTIGSLDFYAKADLGETINIMPRSMFEHIKLANLKETNMLVEMADMTKKVPLGIVENILVKIDKFLFSSDFIIIDMLKTRNETVILGKPFLATIHAEIDVFNKEISLGIENRIIFDMNKKGYKFTTPIEKAYMVNVVHSKELMDIDCDLFLYESESSIPRINEGVHEYWASCNLYENECNRGNMPDSDIKHYWESTNDNERINLTWDNLSVNDWINIRYGKVCKITRDRILKAHWKERFGEEDDDTDEGWQDLEKCGEEKINAILDTVLYKLDDGLFNGTTEDEDDLDGIPDYL
ncbi:putative ribonuclease H-like domain-containing protein [Tanacetum coccineum]